MKIECIVTVGKNSGIPGNDTKPWKLPDDLRHCDELTKGHIVVMGRKTYESLPIKPLPNRINIVLTKNESLLGVINPKPKP